VQALPEAGDFGVLPDQVVRSQEAELFIEGGADEQTIERIAMMQGQTGGKESVRGSHGKDREAMSVAGTLEPIPGRKRKIELSGGVLLADLEGIHRGDKKSASVIAQIAFGPVAELVLPHDQPEERASVEQDHRDTAHRLEALGKQMAGYRDLPMGRHNEAAMAGPGAIDNFRRFVDREQALLAVLEGRLAQDHEMLQAMGAAG
jgi:hypothetical protein